MINIVMQVKIYINDKLYKTVTVEGEKYDPNQYWGQIQADKNEGLLDTYKVDEKFSVRFEPVK